jgi:hypothetical protein
MAFNKDEVGRMKDEEEESSWSPSFISYTSSLRSHPFILS